MFVPVKFSNPEPVSVNAPLKVARFSAVGDVVEVTADGGEQVVPIRGVVPGAARADLRRDRAVVQVSRRLPAGGSAFDASTGPVGTYAARVSNGGDP